MSTELRENLHVSDESDETDEESPRKLVKNDNRRCKYCVKLLRSVSQVAKHEINCEAALKNTANIVTTNDGNRRFLCNTCFRTFKFLTGLSRHQLRHDPPGGYICKFCDSKYCLDSELQKHVEITHMVYKCKLCKEKFNSNESYAEHIIKVHNGRDREYVICEDCGAQFKTCTVLSYHKQSLCGTSKPFKCEQCNSHFQNRFSLKNHLLIHNGEKKYCCSYCGNSFLNKGQLVVHERKHTKEKPFVCNVCSKAFSYRESLVTHSTIHTGIKPYLCEGCGARFSCFGNLQKHRRKRPNTCGQPQFSKNAKAAPRASFKSGRFTKNVKIPKATLVLPDNDKQTKNEFQLETPKPQQHEIICKKEIDLKIEDPDEKIQIIELDDILENDNKISNEISIEICDAAYSANQNTDNKEILVLLKSDNPCEYSETHEKSNNNVEVYEIVKNENFDNDNDDVDNDDYRSDNLYITFQELSEFSKDNSDSNNVDSAKVTDQCESDLTENKNIIKEEIQKIIDYQENEDIDNTDEEDNVPLSKVKHKKQKITSEKSTQQIIPKNEPINSEEEKTKKTDNVDKNQKKFKRKKNLIEMIKSSKRNFECKHCPKIYHQRKSYVKHLINDHSISIVDAEKSLDTELPITDDEILRCKYCAKIYYQLASLKKHEKLHGHNGKLIHKCPCCPNYFETMQIVKKHTKSEHADILTCEICEKIFTGPDALNSHRKRLHQDITMTISLEKKKKIDVCPMCGKQFMSKTELNDHERSNCGQNPLYKCDVCGKHYRSAGSLKTHSNIHTGEIEFKCSYCNKSFRTYGQVKIHERKHNGEKPFKCDLCDKAFAYRESLLTHASSHTGIKRYTCYGCDTRFSCISNLQNHRKTHPKTCGLLPLSTKPVTPMGYNNGSLYVGVKRGNE